MTIRLTAEGDGATRADVTTDLTVTGKPAQFGRGVMQDVSDRLLQQFIGCIEDRLAPQPGAGGRGAGCRGEAAAVAGAAPAPEATPVQPTLIRPVSPVPARPRLPRAPPSTWAARWGRCCSRPTARGSPSARWSSPWSCGWNRRCRC